MQSTGQTSTQALSLTLMQGSAITYAIRNLPVDPVGILGRARAQTHILLSTCPPGVKPSTTRSPRHRGSQCAQLGVERVAKRIAEQVEREDRQADREPRK